MAGRLAIVVPIPTDGPHGLSEEQARALCRRMHVAFQLPTRLERVDGENRTSLDSFPKES